MGFLDDLFDDVMDFVGDLFIKIITPLIDALLDLFGWLFYIIVSTLCNFVKIIYQFFSVFSGTTKIEYNGQKQYLINVFFGNKQINEVYWGMALIGFVFLIFLTIIAVIRKMFDIEGKEQRSIGSILFGSGKSALTILLLSAVLSGVLNLTNLLVDQVNRLFDNAGTLSQKSELVFSDDQFATMARIYNTIGNYSLNASYNSRYNLNTCYNEIRADLLSLQRDHVFDYYYNPGNGINWQYMLKMLVESGDPNYELRLDVMTDSSTAILKIMEELKTNADFFPIASIKREIKTNVQQSVPLDRIVFLMGTLEAAKNNAYNQAPDLTDAARGPFYYGEKNIYSYNAVSSVFETGSNGINYLLIGILAWFTMKNLATCVFNCIARIFNMIGLYIIAPPLAAISPLDGGEKFKQWTTSAIAQTFSIFGNIIPMRLVILFVPIILDSKLVLFETPVMNILGKAIMIAGSLEAANRFSEIFTGILTNNAAYQAVRAGDMSGMAQKALGMAGGALAGTAAFGANLTGLGTLGRMTAKKAGELYQTFKDKGGMWAPFVSHFQNKKIHQAEMKESQLKRRQDAVKLKKLEADEKKYGLTKNHHNIGKGGDD